MSELRGEATQLLDVLVERLSVAQQLLGARPTDEPTSGTTGSTDPGSAAAEPDPAAPASAPADSPVCPTGGHDARQASCSGCPLCALLSMLRGDRPELTAKLVDGALTALQGIRALLAEPVAPSERADPAVDTESGPAAAPAAERIDIR
jgi:hypothetical protein